MIKLTGLFFIKKIYVIQVLNMTGNTTDFFIKSLEDPNLDDNLGFKYPVRLTYIRFNCGCCIFLNLYCKATFHREPS